MLKAFRWLLAYQSGHLLLSKIRKHRKSISHAHLDTLYGLESWVLSDVRLHWAVGSRMVSHLKNVWAPALWAVEVSGSFSIVLPNSRQQSSFLSISHLHVAAFWWLMNVELNLFSVEEFLKVNLRYENSAQKIPSIKFLKSFEFLPEGKFASLDLTWVVNVKHFIHLQLRANVDCAQSTAGFKHSWIQKLTLWRIFRVESRS